MNQTIVLGGGCFWCLEAVFQRVRGVESVISGYAGGTEKDANYYRVATGKTEHAEVVEITFDSEVVSLQNLFEIFFTMHDPTTLNRQGGDVGEQYRSVILYNSDEQKEVAEASLAAAQKEQSASIVTQVVSLEGFFKAEISHQEYYNNNKNSNPYCTAVIDPKIQKFLKKFGDMAKDV